MNSHLSLFLSRIPPDVFIEIRGAIEQLRNGDVHYPFRQNSDFLYLTGLSIPKLILSFFWEEVILWREEITDQDHIWGTDKLSDEEIMDILGISDIRDLVNFEAYRKNISSESIFDPKEILSQMRLIKTPDEIEKIRKAITITNWAFERVKEKICAGMYEYEVEAIFAYEFRKSGVTEAYPTIVASGKNACTLHYTKNISKIENGDLILIDAGCEYMGYASDWTRMLSVGDVSERQKSVLKSVETIKKFAESILKPGIWKMDYEVQVRQAMIIELELLWLIHPALSVSEKIDKSRIYYPHSTSHFLGLDVHDVGPRDIQIEKWMVLTIEPGIYISEENIGVRIEDDYLITEQGCQKLLPYEK